MTTRTPDRLARIAYGYVAACLVAILASLVPFLPLLPFMFSGPAGPAFPLLLVLGVIVFALPPSLVAIVFAERHRIRSRASHLGVGAAVGIVALLLYYLSFALLVWRSPAEEIALLPLFALVGGIPGAIGGLVYHAKAGHEAGA